MSDLALIYYRRHQCGSDLIEQVLLLHAHGPIGQTDQQGRTNLNVADNELLTGYVNEKVALLCYLYPL
jgi:hypothetical protein